jgi:dUTP pyrophosphatase
MNSFIYIEEINGELSLPAKEGDVGYDVKAISEPKIVGKQSDDGDSWQSIDYIEYDLGIKLDGLQPFVARSQDVFTLIFPRSSISNYNLTLANSVGVVDSGYRGNVKVRFKYIFQPEDLIVNAFGNIIGYVNLEKIYKKGDKVCQLVFQPHFHPTIEVVDELEDSERQEGGFGSSGL